MCYTFITSSTVGLFTSASPTTNVNNALCYDIMIAAASLGNRNFSASLCVGPPWYIW